MNKITLMLAASTLAALPILAAPAISKESVAEAAMKDDVAWDIVEGLTTEIGARQAGTPAEAKARIWAVAKLKSLGISNARIEEYQMPTWVRGAETAYVTAPFLQKMHIAALGNSGSTGDAGLEAEIAYLTAA
jgi:carboxypeptidase Q